MKIVYNSPEHAKERQNVTPPSVEDEINVVSDLNTLIAFADKYKSMYLLSEQIERFQNFIFHYENLNHFYTVVGGWEGLEKLQKANEWISVNDYLPELNERVLVCENDYIEICNYEKSSPYSKKAIFINEQDEQPSQMYPQHWKHLPERP